MEFLFRPIPIQGETLSSYIQRVAEKNLITPGQLWKTFNSNKYIYNKSAISQYLDINPYKSFDLDKFEKMLRLNITELEQITFLPIIKKFDFVNSKYLYNSIKTKRYYCPLCLKESNIYKLIWQIKDINFCEKHLVELSHVCWNCKKDVSLLDRYSKVGKCSNCGAILKDKTTITYEVSDAEKTLIDLWHFLLDSSDIKTYHINNLSLKNSLAIKLLYLLKNYNSSTVKRKLYLYVKNEFDYDNFSIDINLIKKILLQTNTSFIQIINENVPEYFIQRMLYENNDFYKNIINLLI